MACCWQGRDEKGTFRGKFERKKSAEALSNIFLTNFETLSDILTIRMSERMAESRDG
jgi:hypothetical protein